MKTAVIFDSVCPTHSEALASTLAGKGHFVCGILLDCDAQTEQKASRVCDRVFSPDSADLKCNYCAADFVASVMKSEKIDGLITPSSPVADFLVPSLAASFGSAFVPYISDVTGENKPVFIRRIFSGKVEETIAAGETYFATYGDAPLKSCTHRTEACDIVKIEFHSCAHSSVRITASKEIAKNHFAKSRAVICAGAAIKERKRFERSILPLAKRLSCTPGVTLDAAAKNIYDRDAAVSAYGSVCDSPVYISIGSSGSMDHLQALRLAGYVIAVGNDADSRIFNRADVAIAGNVSKILHRLEEKITRMMKL